nr:MAG TPA: hypothetical protein [Caudoviricetes sp.]
MILNHQLFIVALVLKQLTYTSLKGNCRFARP